VQRRTQYSRWMVALTAVGLTLATLPTGAVAEREPDPELESPALVEVFLDDRTGLDRLVATGTDLAEKIEPNGSGITAYAVVTPSQAQSLRAQGFTLGRTLETEANWAAAVAERNATIAAKRRGQSVQTLAVSPNGAVKLLRADYFTSNQGEFLSVEAKSVAGDADTLTVRWDSGRGTPMGSGGTSTLQAFVDADVYLYHRRQFAVTGHPDLVEVSSLAAGGEAVTARSVEWLPLDERGKRKDPYFQDFVDHYLDPTELYQRIEQLHAEFPQLTDIVSLPYQTNGYRRKAQALLGSVSASRVVVTSRAYGSEGGNALRIELRDPGAASSPLGVSVTGTSIVVSLATDGAGAVVSTAANVVAALDASASSLVDAHTYRGNAGTGVVAATGGPVALTDFLDAPASISRQPFTVKALRIGKHRDGSRVGVLGYAQEHAREWVTPLVVVETAERLLRNYAHDGATKNLVDNLDIFLVPSANPDGGHYSFYDFNFQRRTMVNYCADNNADPNRRDQWGVDQNRNYPVGSMTDGYTGASGSCTSDVFAGSGELSEQESRNIHWLPQAFPNIRFSMNVHSFGNYFMWSPGAYTVPSRTTLARPSFGTEAFFWAASQQILTSIKASRGTVVTPARTGPIADVLYSAAGNSGDMLYYLYGIYAWNFEVGDQGFQPPFADEGHAQALEFANGLMELFRVAHRWDTDHQRPDTTAVPGQGRYDEPVEVQFEVSEPVTIYYTTDGSRPTLASPTIESAGVREGAQTVLISHTTELKWFSVDAAGNVERSYDPNGNRENYRKALIVIS
jgi:hypothetical protein